MNLRRKLLAFLKSQKKDAEYTELEYLESDGKSWIDTGIPFQPIKAVINLCFVESNTRELMGFGSYRTTYFGKTTAGLFELGGTYVLQNSNAYEWQEVTFTHNGLVTGGSGHLITKFGEITRTDNITDSIQGSSFYLFNTYNYGTTVACRVKISSAKFYNANDKLIMDLIPVLDKDFVPCMYDKISGRFLYNQGDGEFKWKLPNQLEYLESTGTQWIDTGFLSNQLYDKSLYIKMKTTGGTSSYAYNGAYHISGTGLTIQFGLLATSDTLVRTTANHFDPSYLNVTNLQKSEYTELMMTPTEYWVNGEFKANHQQTSVDKILETNNKFLIFGRSQYNQPNSITPMIISSFWIKDANGKFIQYLIPAFDENLNVCMYDLVSKKYFYNQGSGTFKGFFEDGSQLVSYLTASGTQWIDTGITPLMGDELELKNVQCVKKTSGMQAVFSAGTGTYQLIILVADGMYSDRASFYKYFASGGAKNINPPNYLNNPTKIKIDSEGSVFYNDVFIIQSPPENEVNSSMRLFYRANDSQPLTGNIGAVSIKRDSEFVINLVPVVKSDNTACMLDLVNDKYFVNQGSGTFSYGTVVNLFDTTKPSYIAGYISTNDNGNITASTLTHTFYIPCKPNTTYLITRSSVKEENQVWRAATVTTTPSVGMLCPNYVGGLNNDLALTITSREDDKYLMFSEGKTMATDDLTKFTVVEITNYGG